MNPVPFTELPANVFNPNNADGSPSGDWQEIYDVNSPNESSFSRDGQGDNTLVGIVPANKVRSARRWFMGFAYVDQSTGWLVRENPCPHPQDPQMYAAQVTARPYIPDPQPNPNFNPLFPLQAPLKIGWNPPDIRPANNLKFLNYAAYQSAIVTVRFGTLKYTFLQDSQVRFGSLNGNPWPNGNGTNEWNRNVWIDTAPKLDVLTADGISQVAFSETSPQYTQVSTGAIIPAGPVVGTPFPAPIPVLMGKTDYVINWYGVPLNYVDDKTQDESTGLTPQTFFPSNIVGCVGRCNSVPFLGLPAEVLLCKSPSFHIYPWWVPASDGTVMLACDVSIPIEHFDPDLGPVSPTLRGWQTVPFRVNGLWYGAQRTNPSVTTLGVTVGGALNGRKILEEIDFAQIFNNPNF